MTRKLPLKVTSHGTPDPEVVARLLIEFFGRELDARLPKKSPPRSSRPRVPPAK